MSSWPMLQLEVQDQCWNSSSKPDWNSVFGILWQLWVQYPSCNFDLRIHVATLNSGSVLNYEFRTLQQLWVRFPCFNFIQDSCCNSKFRTLWQIWVQDPCGNSEFRMPEATLISGSMWHLWVQDPCCNFEFKTILQLWVQDPVATYVKDPCGNFYFRTNVATLSSGPFFHC